MLTDPPVRLRPWRWTSSPGIIGHILRCNLLGVSAFHSDGCDISFLGMFSFIPGKETCSSKTAIPLHVWEIHSLPWFIFQKIGHYHLCQGKQVVILRAVLMERTGWWMPAVAIGRCKTHRLPVVPPLQCFMTLLPAFLYLQCLYFYHWLTHQWQTWETRLTFPQLLSNFFWQIEPQSIRNVRHVLGYHSSWKFPETLV